LLWYNVLNKYVYLMVETWYKILTKIKFVHERTRKIVLKQHLSVNS
jgi:hypothetical protein